MPIDVDDSRRRIRNVGCTDLPASATLSSMSSLDFNSLRGALEQLEKGLGEIEKDPKNELMRDGVIKRFAYSHELARGNGGISTTEMRDLK